MQTQAEPANLPTGSSPIPVRSDTLSEAPPPDFGLVRDDGVNLVLWRRQPRPELKAELASLPTPAPRTARDRLEPGANPARRRKAIDRLLGELGFDPRELPAWSADLLDLSQRLLRLTGDWPVALRLESIADDACRRFHVDRMRLRLLCTYRGPGTEWLENDQVDRDALMGHRPNERVLRRGRPERMETFWVGLMKGEMYPGNRGNGLVHRSPPIAETGECRLLFCLDA